MIKVLSVSSILLIFLVTFGSAQKGIQKTETKTKPVAGKRAFNLSPKNRRTVQTAIDSISEINSVISVGANYTEFSRTVQLAKVKFDTTMKRFEVKTPGDRLLLTRFSSVWRCYIDAKEVWAYFIKYGDSYGYLDPTYNSLLSELSETYGFKGESRDYISTELRYIKKAYLYDRDVAVGAILNSASFKLELLQKDIGRGTL